MAKQMVFEADARESIRRGVEKLAKAVTTTLGPRGRNAILDKGWGAPTVTKDGVTVAEEIQLQDPYEQMGAQLVKEVASKTSDVAGDGTTTATLLTEAVFTAGLRAVTAGGRERVDRRVRPRGAAHLGERANRAEQRRRVARVDLSRGGIVRAVGALKATARVELAAEPVHVGT